MSLLNLLQPGSLRRNFAQSVFALCVLACLSVALLLTGCSNGDDDDDVIELNSLLIGEWEISGDGWRELYTVTDTHFSFDGFGSWGGRIVHAVSFNATTGVIIIRYDADNKQEWFDWSDFDNPVPISTAGKDYYGIYFRNLTQNTVVFSNTSDQANNWGPSETATLQEAIRRFTLDNMEDWIDMGATAPLTRVVEE